MAGFRILFRRGTDEQRRGIVFAAGEPVWTTDLKQLWIGDGVTPGGVLVAGGGGSGSLAWADITGKPATFPPTEADVLAIIAANPQAVAWADISGKPTEFPPSAHTHTPAQAGADPTGTADAAIAAHLAATDPHPQYRRTFNVRQYGALGNGTADDSAAIQAAIDAAAASVAGLSFGWSTGEDQTMAIVYVPPGTGAYILGSGITVKRGVSLHCPAVLKNALSGSFAPPVTVDPFGWIEELHLDCDGKQGIRAGTANAGAGIKLHNITVANCGSSFSWPDWHAALDVRGFNYDIAGVWTWGGYYGFRAGDASDIRAWRIIAVDAQKGVYLVNVNHSVFLGIDVDTHRLKGVVIDMVRDVRLQCQVWFNDTAATASPTHGVHIGEWTTPTWATHTLELDAVVTNCGGTGLELGDVEDSRIRLVANKATLFTGNGHQISTGIVYGSDIADVDIEAVIDSAIGTVFSGTRAGVLRYSRGGAYVIEADSVEAAPFLYAPGRGPLGGAVYDPSNGTAIIDIDVSPYKQVFENGTP